MKKFRLAFVTSCRSDWAKIRPYVAFFVQREYPVFIFSAANQTEDSEKNAFAAADKFPTVSWQQDIADASLSQTEYVARLTGKIGRFLEENRVEFLFVHGDRPEALAAAAAGALSNIPVCQIEAGDVSGNIDESIRHAITKLSHRFLADDEEAKKLVLRLGEDPRSVFVTGASAITLLPPEDVRQAVLQKYNCLTPYAIVLYHPETRFSPTEQYDRACILVEELNKIPLSYLVISPNQDRGYEEVLRAYKLFSPEKARFFPSLPCEEYLSLLSCAVCLVGNSSSGFKDAPLLGTTTVNVGDRQYDRGRGRNFSSVLQAPAGTEIARLIHPLIQNGPRRRTPEQNARALTAVFERIFTDDFFQPPLQKHFYFPD